MTVYLRKLQQSLITYFSAMTDRLHGFSSPHNLWSLSLFCVGLEFCAIWYLVTISFWTLLLLPSCFSRVRLCTIPETAAHQAPPSMGFSRQEYRSGVPLPSPHLNSYITVVWKPAFPSPLAEQWSNCTSRQQFQQPWLRTFKCYQSPF